MTDEQITQLRALIAKWRAESALPSLSGWFDSKSVAADELEAKLREFGGNPANSNNHNKEDTS